MKEKPFVRIHDEYINVQTILKFEMKNGSLHVTYKTSESDVVTTFVSGTEAEALFEQLRKYSFE